MIGPGGAAVCQWLTDAGITCLLVKYRVPNTGCNWNRETHRHDAPAVPMALQDAQRAISLVRYHANEYGIAVAALSMSDSDPKFALDRLAVG